MLLAVLLSTSYTIGPLATVHSARASLPMMQSEDGPLAAAQLAYNIYQSSRAEGLPFKQAVADAIAGEYDRDATTLEVVELAKSAPVVMFTWEASPACKKALKCFAETGCKPKIVRLDDPWSEGNPRRAALGRLTGKSSVPSIWIGGTYVGGCDDGPSDEAPGLVPLAFRGTLFDKLRAAGALSAGDSKGADSSTVKEAEANVN